MLTHLLHEAEISDREILREDEVSESLETIMLLLHSGKEHATSILMDRPEIGHLLFDPTAIKQLMAESDDKKQKAKISRLVQKLATHKTDTIKIDEGLIPSEFCPAAELRYAKINYDDISKPNTNAYGDGTILVLEGKAIGYVKHYVENSFLATRTVEDPQQEFMLVKGGLYTVEPTLHRKTRTRYPILPHKWRVQEIDTMQVRLGRMLDISEFRKYYRRLSNTEMTFYQLCEGLNQEAEEVVRTKTETKNMIYVGK